MSSSRPVPTKGTRGSGHDFAHSITASFTNPAPIAQEAIARDLAECFSDGEDEYGRDEERARDQDADSEFEGDDPILYRRPTGITDGALRPTLAAPPLLEEAASLTRLERKQSRDAERSLLRDNHILPPKHPRPEHEGLFRRLYRSLFSTKVPVHDEEAPRVVVTHATPETTPLLGSGLGDHQPGRDHSNGLNGQHQGGRHLSEQWEAAVAAGQIRTTWQREAQTLGRYSTSLVVTFLLQYSISVTGIFAVGRIGKIELGAVSLATMTANITGYSLIQGLTTSLDTLCSQAYGSGHKHLVGLQFQRMTWFLMAPICLISVLWYNAEDVLALMIPERRSAELAGVYLRCSIWSLPAFAVFEGGKRFLQAQGIFNATTWILVIVAPINVVVNWLFVWKLGWGFVGAPIAGVLMQNLMPILLLGYVLFVDGYQCWGGFSKRALSNWGPMIRLALPGMIMVGAEYFAFEILTIFSSWFGTSTLAAQTIIVTVTATTFRLPFALSVAGSTRVANLIGAKLVDAAKTSANVMVILALIAGLVNTVAVIAFRYQIPRLFTNDEEVINIVGHVMPVCAIMQIFDALATVAHGLLRGIGRQEFGGYANILVYYLIALPISFGLAFGLRWEITGLWAGVSIGLALVAGVEFLFAYYFDWDRAVVDAENRNAAG